MHAEKQKPRNGAASETAFYPMTDGTHELVFGCRVAAPGGTRIVPIRRAYIVINQISLTRASDSAPLAATALSIQADPLLDTLRVLPRYPLLPWEWSAVTADIILPSAPVVREAIEWVDKARYNRVFVSGTQAGGILGQVTRAGTAGDLVAPMVTDPLITHADGARARGRAVLADTGRQARITLDLPILEETGIIVPGKLVRYTDGGAARVGLVRSTAVRAQLPTARQTIELETHA